MSLTSETREKLMGVAVATISTALFKRGLRGQMIQGVLPVGGPKGRNMVGPAYTLRYIPAREDLDREIVEAFLRSRTTQCAIRR